MLLHLADALACSAGRENADERQKQDGGDDVKRHGLISRSSKRHGVKLNRGMERDRHRDNGDVWFRVRVSVAGHCSSIMIRVQAEHKVWKSKEFPDTNASDFATCFPPWRLEI